MPLVLRVGQGALGGFAAQHSQAQHAWLMGVPGLALCAPADAQEAYVLMRWALRQGDPVVFAEDMRLYRTKGVLDRGGGAPAVADSIPRARVVRSGVDATVLAYGFGTTLALAAAGELAAHAIELEVVDLRMLSPLDERTIGESARHTGRVLCLGDDPLLGGVTATLVATVQEAAPGAVVARLGARHWPTPFGSSERYVYPAAESVAAAVRRLVAWPAAATDAAIENGAFALAATP